MKLELDVIHIKNIRFGEKTMIDRDTLSINRAELVELLKEDGRLGDISVELTRPGEKVRITQVFDVVEPRAKVNNSGVDFPGALGKQGRVGEGSTCVLRGAAVVTCQCMPAAEGRAGRGVQGLIDMWGTGAEVSPYGQTCNVILLPSPSAGTSLPDYQLALKLAGLKAAVYLAQAASDLPPDEVEVFETYPFAADSGNLANLPRVVYIFQVFSNQQLAAPGDPVFYGDNVDGIVPTIIHPNEVLDGAITTRTIDTFLLQNHPVILELYRNHGKSLNFAGVIITTAPNNGPAIDRVSTIAANHAKLLKADGVILTKYGGGAPEMTMGATAQKCERLGIRSALAIQHAGLDTAEISMKPSTIFTDAPEVDAIVSLGTNVGGPNLNLPAAERVIGLDGAQLAGEMIRQVGQIRGATSLIGNSKLMTVRY